MIPGRRNNQKILYRTGIPVMVLVLLSIFQFTQKHSLEYKFCPAGKAWSKTSVNTAIFRKNAVTSYGTYQYTAYYDSLSEVILARRKTGVCSWELFHTGLTGNTADAHNSISLAVDGNGVLHMAWDHHSGPLNYCKINPGEDLLPGKKQSMDGILEEKITYPEFYSLPSGDLLFLYREGQSGKGNLVMKRYDSGSETWSVISRNLVDGEGKRNAYWQFCADESGVFHLSWVWRESPDVASNHDLCYACSSDGGKSWKRSDGSFYSLPINSEQAEIIRKIDQNSDLINQTSMTADRNGVPYIASYWREKGDEAPQFRIVYLSDEGWKTDQPVKRTLDFSLGGEGTRSIPVSRPLLLYDKVSRKLVMIYRDDEFRGQLCLLSGKAGKANWNLKLIPDMNPLRWEPCCDLELWRKTGKLQLFFQTTGQGSGESLSDLPSTFAGILEISKF